MIPVKYLKEIEEKLRQFAQNKKIKVLIFGSSLKRKHFGDIDVGIIGKTDKSEIRKLKENFEDSTLPYFVDLIELDETSSDFKENILNNRILWIKR